MISVAAFEASYPSSIGRKPVSGPSSLDVASSDMVSPLRGPPPDRSASRSTDMSAAAARFSGSAQLSSETTRFLADAKQVHDSEGGRIPEPIAQSKAKKTPDNPQGLTDAEREFVRALKERDEEVRRHEEAHAQVGGQYAGSPTYEYQTGPDQKSYAIGGQVSIDVSKASTPEATIRKMEIIRRAALAPAEPSAQDRHVASQAEQIKAEAEQEVAHQKQVYQKQTEKQQKRGDNPDRSGPIMSSQMPFSRGIEAYRSAGHLGSFAAQSEANQSESSVPGAASKFMIRV